MWIIGDNRELKETKAIKFSQAMVLGKSICSVYALLHIFISFNSFLSPQKGSHRSQNFLIMTTPLQCSFETMGFFVLSVVPFCCLRSPFVCLKFLLLASISFVIFTIKFTTMFKLLVTLFSEHPYFLKYK